MKGALSASYDAQRQTLSPDETSRQVLEMGRNNGLDFSVPHGSGAYASNSHLEKWKRDLTPRQDGPWSQTRLEMSKGTTPDKAERESK